MLRIRSFFAPWIRDPGWGKNLDPVSGMNIPDHFSENIKILTFYDSDPHPGSFRPWIRDPGGKNSDPVSDINIPDPQHCLGATKT
jgi:hypothetical protein